MPRRDPQRYGATHRAHRQRLVRRYEYEGRGWPCALCTQPMHDHPRQLHLAHNDDGSYAGLAHAACNNADAARLGHDRRYGRVDPQPRPRTQW